jgi:hypothetical protein
MIRSYFRVFRNAAIGFAIGGVVATCCYGLLALHSDDAVFLGVVVLLSFWFSVLISPENNFLKGLKQLRLYDWPPLVLVPIVPTLQLASLPAVVQGTYYFCFLTYFTAFMMFVRRERGAPMKK